MQNLENAAGAASPVEADEEALRKCLESVVAERFGARIVVVAVDAVRCLRLVEKYGRRGRCSGHEEHPMWIADRCIRPGREQSR